MNSHLLLVIVSGVAVAFLFHSLRIPGGYMLGAIVGSMAVKFFDFSNVQIPNGIFVWVQIAMGICVGAMFSPEILAEAKSQIPVMAMSTAILLCAGVLSAVLVCRATDLSVVDAILATSPGGLNAAVGLAEPGHSQIVITAFQMLRLYTVICFVPICCWVVRFFLPK